MPTKRNTKSVDEMTKSTYGKSSMVNNDTPQNELFLLMDQLFGHLGPRSFVR